MTHDHNYTNEKAEFRTDMNKRCYLHIKKTFIFAHLQPFCFKVDNF